MRVGMSITVDDKLLRQALRKAPRHMVLAINRSLRRSAVYTQRRFREELPVGATGQLRRSVRYLFRSMTEVNIHPAAKQAVFIEYGTRPHWTSVKNLEKWANQRGISPYAVQRGIAKHGTKAQPYLHKVHASADGYAGTDMSRSLEKAIDEVL